MVREINLLISTVLFCFLAGEAFLRFAGFEPWTIASVGLVKTPSDSLFVADDELGYRVRHGNFEMSIGGKIGFLISHDEDFRRVTRPRTESTIDYGKPQIWIFGCSHVHGWGVSNSESFPWLLQSEFSEYDIANFGVSGYSTLQSLMVLEKNLSKSKPPELIILAYAKFHDQRNLANDYWLKAISTKDRLGGYRYPFLNDSTGEYRLEYKKIRAKGVFGRQYSALLNVLDDQIIRWKSGPTNAQEASKYLIERFVDRAATAGSRFLLVGISPDAETRKVLDFFSSKNVPAFDISFDLASPTLTHLPLDPHPNAAGHRVYAKNLSKIIKALES